MGVSSYHVAKIAEKTILNKKKTTTSTKRNKTKRKKKKTIN